MAFSLPSVTSLSVAVRTSVALLVPAATLNAVASFSMVKSSPSLAVDEASNRTGISMSDVAEKSLPVFIPWSSRVTV